MISLALAVSLVAQTDIVLSECKRTIGVSTTDLVGRMLLLTRGHHSGNDLSDAEKNSMGEFSKGTEVSPYTRVTQFLPTSSRIIQFASGREPKPTDRIVYVDGDFDLFRMCRLH